MAKNLGGLSKAIHGVSRQKLQAAFPPHSQGTKPRVVAMRRDFDSMRSAGATKRQAISTLSEQYGHTLKVVRSAIGENKSSVRTVHPNRMRSENHTGSQKTRPQFSKREEAYLSKRHERSMVAAEKLLDQASTIHPNALKAARALGENPGFVQDVYDKHVARVNAVNKKYNSGLQHRPKTQRTFEDVVLNARAQRVGESKSAAAKRVDKMRKASAARWNEADHPRVPAGNEDGGQFTEK